MPTALVTGASSGIGEQFALQLAERGYELILVARRAERLEELAGKLSAKATPIPCDLANDAGSLPGRVDAEGLDVDLLVNNAGYGTWGRFWELDPEREAEEVRLNCEAVITLTRAFVPTMVERGTGGVINVASSAGMQGLAYEATYSASKAFVITFTDALHMELRGTGVKALSVNPGPVPTEWQEVAGHDSSDLVPGTIEADQVVREALGAFDAGKRFIYPGTVFRWYMRAASLGPKPIKLRVAERMYRPK